MLRLDINLLFTIINLLIWYLLIKKFLFKPVNNIIAKREEAIEGRYKEAEQEKLEAGQQKEKYEALQSGIQDEKAQVMKKAQMRGQLTSRSWKKQTGKPGRSLRIPKKLLSWSIAKWSAVQKRKSVPCYSQLRQRECRRKKITVNYMTNF